MLSGTVSPAAKCTFLLGSSYTSSHECGVSNCGRTVDTDKSNASHQTQDQWSDRCKARSGQGLSQFWLTTSEQELPACGCPGAATFTCQHVRARMYLRMASLTCMARSGLRATERSLARLLTLSGLLLETFSLACKRVRLLPLRALCAPSLPLYVCSESFQTKKSLTLLSLGRRSWGYMFACTCVSPTRYLSDQNVPLDMETLCPVDVVQRPWNWTIVATGWAPPTATVSACHVCHPTAKGQGRLQRSGPPSPVLEKKTPTIRCQSADG